MKKNRSRRFGWAYTAAIIGAGLAALLLLAPACRSEKAPAGADAAAAVPAVKAAASANVKTGLAVLLEKRLDLIKGKRIGLITNPSAVDRRLRSAIDLLREADGAKLAASSSADFSSTYRTEGPGGLAEANLLSESQIQCRQE